MKSRMVCLKSNFLSTREDVGPFHLRLRVSLRSTLGHSPLLFEFTIMIAT